MSADIWCEFCRDHFERDHFPDGDTHGVGEGYGPYGGLLAKAQAFDALQEVAEELADQAARAVVEPRRFRGDEDFRQALGEAIGRVRRALSAPSTGERDD